MKITINPDNLVIDDSFQMFHKVRAIIENENGEYIISQEGGKYIFPGGKRKAGETDIEAIIREIKEETGIFFNEDDFKKILEIETIYKNFYDYRTDSLKPRYTNTIYYYVKCSKKINGKNMNLTSGEIKEKFKVEYVSKEKLFRLLTEDHKESVNGVFFDEENRIILDNFLQNKNELT